MFFVAGAATAFNAEVSEQRILLTRIRSERIDAARTRVIQEDAVHWIAGCCFPVEACKLSLDLPQGLMYLSGYCWHYVRRDGQWPCPAATGGAAVTNEGHKDMAASKLQYFE
jgi:hypothetical protein